MQIHTRDYVQQSYSIKICVLFCFVDVSNVRYLLRLSGHQSPSTSNWVCTFYFCLLKHPFLIIFLPNRNACPGLKYLPIDRLHDYAVLKFYILTTKIAPSHTLLLW